MTVKKCEKDKQIAKLQRKIKSLESKNQKQAAELKANRKEIRGLHKEENKKKDNTISLTKEQYKLLSDL